jgi:hypothetical protein
MVSRAMVLYQDPELGPRQCHHCQDDSDAERRNKVFASNWKLKRHLAYVHNDPPQVLSSRKLNKGKGHARTAVQVRKTSLLRDDEFMKNLTSMQGLIPDPHPLMNDKPLMDNIQSMLARFPDPDMMHDKKFMDNVEQSLFRFIV